MGFQKKMSNVLMMSLKQTLFEQKEDCLDFQKKIKKNEILK